MELRQLKYFLTVADMRSIVGAANSLYISRQAVSKAVAQLESELGVDLFVRDSNGAFLTPAGIMFYDRVRSSVMDLEEIRNEMQHYGSKYHQTIRIAFAAGTVQLYEDRLLQYISTHKNTDISYSEYPQRDCFQLLQEHKADLAVCTEDVQNELLSTEEILQSPFGIVVQSTNALLECGKIGFDELRWLPLAGLSDGKTAVFVKKYGLRLQYSGCDFYRLFSLTSSGRCAMLLPEILFPKKWPGLLWLPLDGSEPWHLYRVFLKSLEKNTLYRTAIDDLQNQVFFSDFEH